MVPQRRPQSDDRQLILIFNTIFGAARRDHALPPGFELTYDLRRLDEARAVLFHIPGLGNINGLEKRDGQVWVGQWFESGEHSKFAKLNDPEFMARFDLTMSFRRDSDVFTPYFGRPWFERLEQRLLAEPGPKNGLAAMFVSGTMDRSGRTEYLTELMKYLPVSSYGKVLRNQRLRRDRGRPTLVETIAGFKFTLAFENAIDEDYVTEKFYNPLCAGSVPVYLGAPNVDQLAPGKGCYIDVRDFAGPRELAERLLELDADDEQYQRYFDWKQKPFRPEFQQLLDRQRQQPLTRLCELLS